MEKLTLKIDGMTCGNCVAHVTKALKELDGVAVEQVSIGSAMLSFDPAATSEERITQAVEDEGYQVAAATH
jgi:copper chaperone